MTVEVILKNMKYWRIHNVSIHINVYQNRFINECVRKNFLNSRKDRCKDGFFLWDVEELTFLIMLINRKQDGKIDIKYMIER